jgi:hypothetical protein
MHSVADVTAAYAELLSTVKLNNNAISSQPPLQNSTELVAPVLFFITILYGPSRKHHFQQ